MRRRWVWLGALLVVIGAAAHSAAWWFVTSRLEDGMPAFVAGAATYGWRVESGPPARGGWPFTATVSLPSLKATRLLGGTTVRWTADRIDVSVSPIRPLMLELAPAGAQTIEASDGAKGGAVLPFSADRVVARTPLTGGPIALMAEALVAGTAATGVKIARVNGTLDEQSLTIDASGIAVAPGSAPPFDGPIDLAVALSANIPFPASPTPGSSAAAWQAAGGRMELSNVALRWGTLALEGSGTFRLDAQLQPEGRTTLRVQGAMEALDAMAKGGLLAPGPASAARAVLGLLVLAAHGGPVTLPVAVSGRVVKVSQFPVLRLPLLDWNLP